jgi:hypothetical protein
MKGSSKGALSAGGTGHAVRRYAHYETRRLDHGGTVLGEDGAREALDLGARADDTRRDGQRREGHRPQEIEGQARDLRVEPGLARERAGEECGRRATVLMPLAPRPARRRGGDEPVAVGDEERRKLTHASSPRSGRPMAPC